MPPSPFAQRPLMLAAARVGLLGLASARLTRLVTSDALPEYVVIGRLRERAQSIEHAHRKAMERTIEENRDRARAMLQGAERESLLIVGAQWQDRLNSGAPLTWAARSVKGLDCPFCVGFWIGAAVLVTDHVAQSSGTLRPLRAPWHLALAALALNYVVGHVSSRIDG